jgi:hypothetical protein
MIAEATLIDARAGLEQRFDGLHVPLAHGEEERCQPALVADEFAIARAARADGHSAGRRVTAGGPCSTGTAAMRTTRSFGRISLRD